jgi:hypothetical protein
MANKKFWKEYDKSHGKAMQCTKQWLSTGCTVFVDSGIARVYM